MRVEKLTSQTAGHWRCDQDPIEADLVLYFGTRAALEEDAFFDTLRQRYPAAALVGCSSGGQMLDGDVVDDTATAIAIGFAATTIKLAIEETTTHADSNSCGVALGQALSGPDLAGLFVLSDGLSVNGSDLAAGLTSAIGDGIPISGGLAGDGADFKRTLVGANQRPRADLAVAVGFYGDQVKLRTGSAGGWDQFGPHRTITRAEGNVLHELDGQPALDLYERYLGEDARGLPGTALLFPLKVFDPDNPDHDVVRTVLSVDNEARSMTFAGNMPEGWTAQLMRGRFDQLAQGSAEAARSAKPSEEADGGVALLVSCIGRRLLMGQHITDEVEAAMEAMGQNIAPLGFYSYGEIAPHAASGVAELHNQTMTITTIAEAA
jgi:hypothetical protein